MIIPPFIFIPKLSHEDPSQRFQQPEPAQRVEAPPIPPLEERLEYKPLYKYGINCDEYYKFTEYVYDNYGPIKKFLSRISLAKSFGFPKSRQKILNLASVTKEQVKRLNDLDDVCDDYKMYLTGGFEEGGRSWTKLEAYNAIHKYIRELKSNSIDLQKKITEMLKKEDEWIKFYQSQTEDEMENE